VRESSVQQSSKRLEFFRGTHRFKGIEENHIFAKAKKDRYSNYGAPWSRKSGKRGGKGRIAWGDSPKKIMGEEKRRRTKWKASVLSLGSRDWGNTDCSGNVAERIEQEKRGAAGETVHDPTNRVGATI